MLSPFAAWRVSLQRMRSDWPIVAAAWLVTLLAATLLAAGPIYSDAVPLAGLKRALADAPVRDVNVEVTATLARDELNAVAEQVEAELGAIIGPIGADIERSAESETFALPDQPTGEVRDLATVGFVEGISDHASVVEGQWPGDTADGEPLGVAVSEQIADELGWSVGDALQLTSRRDEELVLPVRVTGIFRVTDPDEAFWMDDELSSEGYAESPTYRTFGPLIATPRDLLERVVSGRVRLVWHAFPRFEALELDHVEGLRQRMADLPNRFDRVLAGNSPTTTTELDDILADAQRSLLVSRTGVLLLIVQLAVMAAFAIVLNAGLLAEHRRSDTALLRSRGAGSMQVATIALVEALVLAVPAAVAAPFLAAGALYLFNVAGPLAEVGLGIRPQLSTTAFVVSATAALVAALLLVMPAFLAARSFVDENSARSRMETRTIGQRLGIDLALLAITAIGFWQLRLYGAPLTQTVRGSLGLDPLLVAAPAIGMLAGAVLALRMVPLLASAAEALTRRGRQLVGSLGSREVARRPLRYTRASLLLMLAVAIGVFAVSYSETWGSSQEDQAAYQVGADVRLTTGSGGSALPAWALDGVLRDVPGVEALMPVSRATLRLPVSTRQGEALAVDAQLAPGILTLRDDLGSDTLAGLLGDLASERPSPPLPQLEGSPRFVRLDVRTNLERLVTYSYDVETGEFLPTEVDPSVLGGRPVVGAEVVVRDGRGMTQRFTTDAVPLGPGGEEQIVVPLAPATPRAAAALADSGADFSLPLHLLSVDITLTLPQRMVAGGGRIELLAAASSQEASGTTWDPVDLDAGGGWSVSVVRNQGPRATPPPEQVDDRAFILGGTGRTADIVGVRPGVRPPAITFLAAALEPLAATALPAIVNNAFLADTAAGLGDEVNIRLQGAVQTVRVVGSVTSFPTTDPSRPAAVVDLPAMSLTRHAVSLATDSPGEWWLATAPGSGGDVAAAIDASPYFRQGSVMSRADRFLSLSADPVALGIIGALSLGFVVAGLFAVIGLTVSAAVMARQRRTEFALLRALGLSFSQLSGWLWLENGGLVVVSIAAGTGLGLVIGWVVLPFVTVTQQAANPFPPPLVHTAWPAILALVAVSTAALGVTMVVLARVLRRIGIGSVLRMGED